MKALFDIKNLNIFYDKKKAVKDVDLQIYKNKITVFVGRSGCGKSSVLKSISRLCEYFDGCRLTGDITYGEKSIFKFKGRELRDYRRIVSYVSQKPSPFPLSIRKNFEIPLAEMGVSKRDIPQIIKSHLLKVGLWDELKNRLDEKASVLSGGQQQRLCLARALSVNPEVLLLDEPTSSLDPLSVQIIEDIMLDLKKSKTIILVTHNLTQAKRLADEVVLFAMNNEGVGYVENTFPVIENEEPPAEGWSHSLENLQLL